MRLRYILCIVSYLANRAQAELRITLLGDEGHKDCDTIKYNVCCSGDHPYSRATFTGLTAGDYIKVFQESTHTGCEGRLIHGELIMPDTEPGRVWFGNQISGARVERPVNPNKYENLDEINTVVTQGEILKSELRK